MGRLPGEPCYPPLCGLRIVHDDLGPGGDVGHLLLLGPYRAIVSGMDFALSVVAVLTGAFLAAAVGFWDLIDLILLLGYFVFLGVLIWNLI